MAPPAPFAAVDRLPSYHKGAPAIAAIIQSVSRDADLQAASTAPADSPFRGRCTVDAPKYLAHLIKHSDASPAVVVIMFMLIDRWAKRFALTSQCLHRVMSAAFIVAAYARDDEFLSISDYEGICGISSTVLRDLVTVFLGAIEFDVRMSAKDVTHVEGLLSRYRGS
eukprot:TRINITY_DN5443_c0_g1_i1.p1 TRINITY_DN5443_c0_g1~~TRINITY_DN5443_c0_g1_i1.p1  ORF type:complete len:194 (+),score=71.31 TRINITY_DN5443_c0_g1_i1:84-584(+)